MAAIPPNRFIGIQGKTLVDTNKKSNLTNVVKTAISILKEKKHELTYVDINRLYATYQTALQKHRFSGLLLWWNAGTLKVLRQERDKLLKNLIDNPSQQELKKLIDTIPNEMISHDSREKLADFILKLPKQDQKAYIHRFIQGSYQSVIEDLSSRSDFIERCPGIISEGIFAYNIEASKSRNPVTQGLMDLLSKPHDHDSLQDFSIKHRTEIANIKKGTNSLDLGLVKILESKLTLLSKEITVKSGLIPLYQLQEGGTFTIGAYKYSVSRKGIEPKDALGKDSLDPHQRLVLVQALVRSGNLSYLPAVFSPSLIGNKLDQESAKILKTLLTEKDPTIVIRAAFLLKESGHKFDTGYVQGCLPKYLDGIVPAALHEVHSLLQIPELKDASLEKKLLSQVTLPEMKPLETKSKKQAPDEISDKVKGKKPESMPQVQQALQEFERIKEVLKKKEKETPLTDEFKGMKDLSKLQNKRNELSKAVEAAEVKVYANLPPFSPPLQELILLYAQSELQPQEMNNIAELLTLKQRLQKCDRIIDSFPDPDKVQQQIDAVQAYKDPLKNPFMQVFEYLLNIYARPQQIASIEKLTEEDKKVVLQILMNSGKSYLTAPVIALMQADGEKLSSIMVPEELSPEMVKGLQEKLGVSFNRMITQLPKFDGDPTVADLQKLLFTLHDTTTNKGVLVVTPQSKHALINSLAVILYNGRNDLSSEKLLLTLKILYYLSRSESVLADEVDQLLKINLQYIVSLGKPKQFEEPQRRMIADLVLFVRDHDFGVSFDFVKDSKGPRVTIESYHEKVKGPLAKEAIRLLGLEKNYVETNKELLELILTSKQQPDNAEKAKQAEEFLNSLDPGNKKLILDLRETLVDVLPNTFFSNCNDEYGITNDQENFLPKPLKEPGVLDETEFSNGPEKVARMVQAILKQGIPEAAFKKIKTDSSIEELLKKENTELLRTFLRNFALPQIEINPEHAVSTSTKLVSSSNSYSGMSGTIWNASTFSGHIDQIIPDAEAEVRALSRLEEKTKTGEISFSKVGSGPKHDELLQLIKDNTSRLALIDTGGWLRDIPVEEFAKRVLDARPDLKAVKYYDKNGILQQIGVECPLSECFHIYTKNKTTGADNKLFPTASGIETVSKKMILRDFQQGIFRMREIMEKQGGLLAYDDEALTQIESLVDVPENKTLDWNTLFRFLVTSQVIRRLNDNYQAVHQRMDDALELKIREKMYGCALKDDVDGIWKLFDEHRDIFIQKQEKEIPKDWKFPVLMPKKERIKLDVESYVTKFEKIGVSRTEAQELLKNCYDLNELNEEIESKDPSTVGQLQLNMAKRSVGGVNEQITTHEMQANFEKLLNKKREEVSGLKGEFIPPSLKKRIDTFSKSKYDSLTFDKDLKEAVLILQEFEIAKKISMLEKDIPDLEAIEVLLGKNSIFQEYQKLHLAVKRGEFDKLPDFENVCRKVQEELGSIEKVIKINPRNIKAVKEYKNEVERRETQMNEFKKALDSFKSSPAWIKEKGVGLLDKPEVEIPIVLDQMRRENEQFEEVSKSLSTLIQISKDEPQAKSLLIKAKDALTQEGFKGFDAQIESFKKHLSETEDRAYLESLKSSQSAAKLGVTSSVQDQIQLLTEKGRLESALLDISSDLSNGLRARVSTCSKNITAAKSQIHLASIENEISSIRQAKGFYKEKTAELNELLKNNKASKNFTQLINAAVTKLNESLLNQTEEIVTEITKLQKMQTDVQALFREKEVIAQILKENAPSEDIKEAKQDISARNELESCASSITALKSDNLSQFHNLVLKNIEEVKEKKGQFLKARAELKEQIHQRVVAADEYLTICMQHVPKGIKLYQRIVNAGTKYQGVRFLSEVAEIKKAVAEFGSVRVGELSKRLQKLLYSFDVKTFKKLESKCLELEKKLNLSEVELLDKTLTEHEKSIEKKNGLSLRIENAKQLISQYKFDIRQVQQIDTLDIQNFNAKSSKDLEKVEKGLVELEKSIQHQVEKEKYSKQVDNLISVNDSSLDPQSFDELVKVVQNSPYELPKGSQKALEAIIERTAAKGDLKRTKALLDASKLGTTRVLQNVLKSFAEFSGQQLAEDTQPILRIFLEDEKLCFNLDELLGSFANQSLERTKKLVLAFKEAGFDEKLAFLTLDKFQAESAKVQASLCAQALFPLAKAIRSDTVNMNEDDAQDTLDYVDTAIEMMTAAKRTNEVDQTIDELKLAKDVLEKSLKEIKTTNEKIKKVSKKVLTSMLLGTGALAMASTGFAPMIALALAKSSVSKITSIVTDPIVEKLTSTLDEKYRPVASLLLGLGFSYALAEVTSQAASGILSMVNDVTSAPEVIDTMKGSSQSTGKEAVFGQPTPQDIPSQHKGKLFDFKTREVYEQCELRTKNVTPTNVDMFKNALQKNAKKVFETTTENIGAVHEFTEATVEHVASNFKFGYEGVMEMIENKIRDITVNPDITRTYDFIVKTQEEKDARIKSFITMAMELAQKNGRFDILEKLQNSDIYKSYFKYESITDYASELFYNYIPKISVTGLVYMSTLVALKAKQVLGK